MLTAAAWEGIHPTSPLNLAISFNRVVFFDFWIGQKPRFFRILHVRTELKIFGNKQTPKRFCNLLSSIKKTLLSLWVSKPLQGIKVLWWFGVFSHQLTRESNGWKKSFFTSSGWQKNENVWTNPKGITVNGVPLEVLRPKPLGPQLGFDSGNPLTMITPRLFHTSSHSSSPQF